MDGILIRLATLGCKCLFLIDELSGHGRHIDMDGDFRK
jgi:hypothetical protein